MAQSGPCLQEILEAPWGQLGQTPPAILEYLERHLCQILQEGPSLQEDPTVQESLFLPLFQPDLRDLDFPVVQRVLVDRPLLEDPFLLALR